MRMKAALRFAARDRRIPVVMAADDSDSAVVDVERFDLEPDRPLYHGLVDEDELRDLPAEPSADQRIAMLDALLGTAFGPRTQSSFQQVGARIPQWSQLATGATVSGAAITYVARRILTGQSMPSGRHRVCLDALLDPDFSSPEAAAGRRRTSSGYSRDIATVLETLA